VLLPTPLLLAIGACSFRDCNTSELARERLGVAIAGAVPVMWYILFATHTIRHSFYIVRPLALNVALCLVAAPPPWRSTVLRRDLIAGRDKLHLK
jgi:hypothetical protein